MHDFITNCHFNKEKYTLHLLKHQTFRWSHCCRWRWSGMAKKGDGDTDGREEGEPLRRRAGPTQAEERHSDGHNGTTANGHGAQNGTNSNNQAINGHAARHTNGCGQSRPVHPSRGSLHPTGNGSTHGTNGSYANPLNASTLPTHTAASPLLLPTYPWDNESDEERWYL